MAALAQDRNKVSNIVYALGRAQTGDAPKTSNQAFYKWIQPVR